MNNDTNHQINRISEENKLKPSLIDSIKTVKMKKSLTKHSIDNIDEDSLNEIICEDYTNILIDSLINKNNDSQLNISQINNSYFKQEISQYMSAKMKSYLYQSNIDNDNSMISQISNDSIFYSDMAQKHLQNLVHQNMDKLTDSIKNMDQSGNISMTSSLLKDCIDSWFEDVLEQDNELYNNMSNGK